jgi:hypothetical protein
MEIVGLVSAILLALLLVALLHTIFTRRDNIPYYRPIRDKFKKKNEPPPMAPTQRMFVAIRRNPNGRAQMMSADSDIQEQVKGEMIDLLDKLVQQWSGVAGFQWGFHGSEYGLPSSWAEEGWMLFACFVVADYNSYRTCYDVMQMEPFVGLQKQFDIRLLYGEKMVHLPLNADELFKKAFSR